MKKKFTLVLSAMLMTAMVWDYHFQPAHTNGGGAPAGNTGSPGDGSSCAQIGCHAGGPAVSNETIAITSDVPPSGYVPGATYSFSLTATKPAGEKFGFQLAAQNQNGSPLGTLIAGTGSQLVGAGNYLTHTFAGTTGAGSRTWDFEWTAPESGTGEVTFYAAVNFTNNNNTTSGDVITTESISVNESTVGISEALQERVSIYPNPVVDVLTIAMSDVDEEIMIGLFTLDGKRVLDQTLTSGTHRVDMTSLSLEKGVYLLDLRTDEGARYTERIVVR